jgi:hypothetical protein
MRSLALVLAAGIAATTAACASSAPAGAPEFTSVRERLAQPTRLYVAPGTSTGVITAARYTHDGWVSGMTPLSVSSGEVDGVLRKDGRLEVTQFEVGVNDIDIPESVFGKPAQLTDVTVALPQASLADVIWTSDDDATATLTLALDLQWTLVVDGNAAPLGAQHLPPVTVDVAITGAGDHVDASLALDATGELWNWADLLKLTELKLSLAAATQDDAEM